MKVSISFPILLAMLSLALLFGCADLGRYQLTLPSPSNPSAVSQSSRGNSEPGSGGAGAKAKIKSNPIAECDGVSITDTGMALYKGIAPYLYVHVKNESGSRKKITMDIDYRRSSENYMGTHESSWTETWGPQPLRSGEETNFIVKDDLKGVTMEQVELVECK